MTPFRVWRRRPKPRVPLWGDLLLARLSRLKSACRRVIRAQRKGGASSDEAFRAFAAASIDGPTYLEAYADVRAAGLDPAEHWLDHGLYEGRVLARGLVVQRGVAPTHWRRESRRRFVWRGEAITVSAPLPASLWRQIVAQSHHEPAVLAPGELTISRLPWREGQDLLARDGIDTARLFGAAADRPRVVSIVPALREGEAATELIGSLLAAGGGPILVLVTEQTAKDAGLWRDRKALSALHETQVIFWDGMGRGLGHDGPRVVANFLNGLRPEAIVVIGSGLGLAMAARHGRGLSQHTRLYCVFFETDRDGPNALLDARATLPYAMALTGDAPSAERLRNLFGAIPGPGIAVLPRDIRDRAELFGLA
jgi:hypothetical protein